MNSYPFQSHVSAGAFSQSRCKPHSPVTSIFGWGALRRYDITMMSHFRLCPFQPVATLLPSLVREKAWCGRKVRRHCPHVPSLAIALKPQGPSPPNQDQEAVIHQRHSMLSLPFGKECSLSSKVHLFPFFLGTITITITSSAWVLNLVPATGNAKLKKIKFFSSLLSPICGSL